MSDLRSTLFYQPKNGYDRLTEQERTEMEAYARD